MKKFFLILGILLLLSIPAVAGVISAFCPGTMLEAICTFVAVSHAFLMGVSVAVVCSMS